MLSYLRGPVHEDPWPFDILLNGEGFLLGKASEGDTDFLSYRPKDLSQVAPTDYSYSAQNPMFGSTNPYGDLSLGLGLAKQEKFGDRQYYYALNANLSHSHAWYKGPEIPIVTLDLAEPVRWAFTLGGTLFLVSPNSIWRRDSATTYTRLAPAWTGAVTDVLVFASNATGVAQYAFFAMGDANPMVRFDGTTFAQHATATMKATSLCLVGEQVFRSHSINQVAVLDINADFWVEANWSAANAFIVGDRSAAITNMALHPAGAMLIFKEDGVYSLSPTGDWVNLYPDMGFASHPDNGKVTGVFLNDLYVSFQEGFFKINPQYEIEGASPPSVYGNPVQGQISAFQSHGSFHGYAGLWNPDTNRAYLMLLGGYVHTDEGEAKRIDAWHGSISPEYATKRVMLLYRSDVGAPAGHSLMYIGFSDGTLGTFVLPHTFDPAGCEQYRFSTAQGKIRLPDFKGAFFDEEKVMNWLTVVGRNLSHQSNVTISYRTSDENEWTPLSQPFNLTPSKRVDFPANTVAISLGLEVYLNSMSPTFAPVVEGVGLQHRVKPDLQEVFEFLILCEDGLRRKDGVPMRRGKEEIEQEIRELYDQGTISAILHDGTEQQIALVDYSKADAWDDPGNRKRSAIRIVASQVRINQVYGTVRRLKGRTIGSLSGITIEQLRTM